MRETKFRFVEDFNTPHAKVWDLTEEGVKACMAANKDDQFGHTVADYIKRIILNEYPNVLLIQFTGLHDKNGKPIFEGDVLLVPNYDCDPSNGDNPNLLKEVVYGPCEFQLREGSSFEALQDYWTGEDRCNDAEVVGDIYTTPELITA